LHCWDVGLLGDMKVLMFALKKAGICLAGVPENNILYSLAPINNTSLLLIKKLFYNKNMLLIIQ